MKPIPNLDLQEIIETMNQNLNYLTALSFNTIEIDDSLCEVQYYWSNIKDSLFINGKVSLENTKMTGKQLFELCNSVLKKANTTTKMHVDLSKSTLYINYFFKLLLQKKTFHSILIDR